MNTMHTPGPWEIADLPHGLVVRTESKNKSKYGASRYASIGGFDRSDHAQLEEAKANARLIAAAPELLEALQEAFEFADGWKELSWLGKARAALAKAKGDAS